MDQINYFYLFLILLLICVILLYFIKYTTPTLNNRINIDGFLPPCPTLAPINSTTSNEIFNSLNIIIQTLDAEIKKITDIWPLSFVIQPVVMTTPTTNINPNGLPTVLDKVTVLFVLFVITISP